MQTLCTLISTMWFTLREFTRWPYHGYWIWRTTILLRLLVSDWPYLITSPSNEYNLSSALTTLKEKEAQVTLLIQTEPGINWWATVQSVYLCYYNHRTMQAWRSGGCVWTNAGTHTHCPHFWLGLHCPTSKKVPTIYTVLHVIVVRTWIVMHMKSYYSHVYCTLFFIIFYFLGLSLLHLSPSVCTPHAGWFMRANQQGVGLWKSSGRSWDQAPFSESPLTDLPARLNATNFFLLKSKDWSRITYSAKKKPRRK